MNYAGLLFFFGVIPIVLLWITHPGIVRRYKGSLLVIVILIMMVSIPWEIISINHIWYYSPHVLAGPRLINLPVEELVFYIIDGLLVGTVALLLDEKKPR